MFVVLVLLAIAAYAGYAYGQSSSNSNKPQLSISSANWGPLSGESGPGGACNIQPNLASPEATCGVTINPGQSGEIDLTISNGAGRGVAIAFSVASTDPSVYFVTYGCGQSVGFCALESSGSFQFIYDASQSHNAAIQVSLSIAVGSLSS